MKEETYLRIKEIQVELNELYKFECLWREICHNGTRNKTTHRKGKFQKSRAKIVKRINELKNERYELKLLDGGDINR